MHSEIFLNGLVKQSMNNNKVSLLPKQCPDRLCIQFVVVRGEDVQVGKNNIVIGTPVLNRKYMTTVHD